MSKNRLAFSSSPYLKQHKDNPVHWYEWSEDAFETARLANKPIFLSIGYATCHWCHVMAHECFEDQEVADYLNEHFISIKLDREERPDIDHLYMTVCQVMNGHGGWPLTVFMNAQKEPFFTGTYFPKYSRNGRPGLLEISNRIIRTWNEKPEMVQDYTERIRALLNDEDIKEHTGLDTEEITSEAFFKLKEQFDQKHAGFGKAPKFPSPHTFEFLSVYGHYNKSPEAFYMVEESLKAIRAGGLFDHVGFGVHRYSTDRKWLVPHFEKMLYDQAGLIRAWIYHLPWLKDHSIQPLGEEIFTYLNRDLKSPKNGYYSAEDADSEGEEGVFYIWSKSELDELIPENLKSSFYSLFNVFEAGNFKDEATSAQNPNNILHLTNSLSNHAIDQGIHLNVLKERIDYCREILLNRRSQRIRPERDEKILTDWNAWLISALSKAYQSSNDTRYLEAAKATYSFIEKQLHDKKGQLLHRFLDNVSGIPAMAPDYTMLALAELDLFAATFELTYLEAAKKRMDLAIDRLWDSKEGGFYFAEEQTDLIARQKDFYDGASPSANSIAFDVLSRLFDLTGDIKFRDKVDQLIKAFTPHVKAYTNGHLYFLKVLLLNQQRKHLILATKTDDANVFNWVKQLRKIHSIGLEIIVLTESNKEKLAELAPHTQNIELPENEIDAYLCLNHTCERPIQSLKDLLLRLS